MCCFSGPVVQVSRTRIFARPLEGGRQRLVYAMKLAATSEVAMVLPLPVPPRSADDAVRFVDLSACPAFFEELESLFPRMQSGMAPQPASFGPVVRNAPLVVHHVGAFEASFVPTRADFVRLDPRFQLSPAVWDALPRYADWGFAVFQLRTSDAPPARTGVERVVGPFGPPVTPVDFHPMAFDFPHRDPTRLFFPTVHVHDGVVHTTAAFDHDLFCQVEGEDRIEGWSTSPTTVGQAPWSRPAFGWLDGARRVHRQSLRGVLPNEDVWVPG